MPKNGFWQVYPQQYYTPDCNPVGNNSNQNMDEPGWLNPT
jgi:hypothetical protein